MDVLPNHFFGCFRKNDGFVPKAIVAEKAWILFAVVFVFVICWLLKNVFVCPIRPNFLK